MSYLDKQKVINAIKQHKPEFAQGLTDEQIYQWAVENINPATSGVKDAKFAPWVQPSPLEDMDYGPTNRLKNPTESSPDPKSFLDSVSDFHLTGWVGDLTGWNYLKYSAQQGIIDMSRAAITGESNYQLYDENGEVIDYYEYQEDLNILQDVAAWGLGQLNPADIAIWWATGSVAKWFQIGGKATQITVRTAGKYPGLTKGGLGWMRDKFSDSVRNKAVQLAVKTEGASPNVARRFLGDTIRKIPSSAASIGTFSAATGTIGSAYAQRMSEIDPETGIGIGEVSVLKTITDGGIAAIEGAVLGAAIAPVHAGAGMLSRRLAKGAEKMEPAGSKFKQAYKNIITSEKGLKAVDIAGIQTPALGLESGIFALTPYTWDSERNFYDEEGNFNWDQVLHDWAHSTATLGMIKGSFKGLTWYGNRNKAELDNYDDPNLSNSGKNRKNALDNLENLTNDTDIDPAELKRLQRSFEKNEVQDGAEINGIDPNKLSGKKEIKRIFDETIALRKKISEIPEKENIADHLSKKELKQALQLYTILHVVEGIQTSRLKGVDTKTGDWSKSESMNNYVDNHLAKEFKRKNDGRDWTPEERQRAGDQFVKEATKYAEQTLEVSKRVNESFRENENWNRKKSKDENKKLTSLNNKVKKIKDKDKQAPILKKLSKLKELVDKIIDQKKPAADRKKIVEDVKKLREEIEADIEAPSLSKRIDNLKKDIKSAMLLKAKGKISAKAIKDVIDAEIVTKDGVVDKVATEKALKERLEKIVEVDKGIDKTPGKTKSAEEFKKSAKDEKSPQIRKRINELAKKQKEIETEEVFDKPADKDNHKSNIEIIKHFIQNVWPSQKGTAGATVGSYIKDHLRRVTHLNKFSKWLTEKGYTFRNFDNDILKKYLGENRSHDTAINQLVEYIQRFKLNTNVTLGKAEIKAAARKEVADVKPGLQSSGKATKIKSTGKASGNTVEFIPSKQAAKGFVTKPITQKLANLLTGLRDKAKQIASDFLFSDKDGTPLTNKSLHGFVNTFFGKKTDMARAFRKSITSWASEKGLSKEDKGIIKSEILQDKTGTDAIEKAYDKFERTAKAEKILKRFLADVNAKKKGTTSADYFTPQEIAKGLELILKSKKEVKFKDTDGKDIVLDKATAEALARYLIETSPRINEVVPSAKDVKKGPQERMTQPKGTKPKRAATTTEEARAEKIRQKLNKKKNNLNIEVKKNQKELLDKDGKPLGEDVVETVQDGVVKVRAGASIEATVHGMMHPVYKLLNSIHKAFPKSKLGKTAAGLVRSMESLVRKDGKANKLYKDWVKTYTKEAAKNKAEGKDYLSKKEIRRKALEEAWVSLVGEYVAGRVMDKTMFRRIKDWAHRTYAILKTKFKSADKLTEQEAIMLLGEAYMKGKITKGLPKEIDVRTLTYDKEVGKDSMEYMTAKASDRDAVIILLREQVKDVIKNVKAYKLKKGESLTQKVDMLIDMFSDVAEKVEKEVGFTLGTTTVENLLALSDYVRNLDTKKMTGKTAAQIRDRLDIVRQIEKNIIDTDMNSKKEADFIKLANQEYGINSKSIHDAPMEVLREWNQILIDRKVDRTVHDVVINAVENLVDGISKEKLERAMGAKFHQKMQTFLAKNLLSFTKLCKYLDLKELNKWTYRHLSAEQRYVGPWIHLVGDGGTAVRILGKDVYNKLKPVFGLIEARENGSLDRINDPTADPKERAAALKFAKKAFILEERIDKKGKVKYYSKGINWDPSKPKDKRGTKEGLFLFHIKHEMMRSLESNFMDIAEGRYTAAKLEKFLKDNDIKFLNKTSKAFYIPKRMTREFGMSFQAHKYEKEVERMGRATARQRAKEQYGDEYKNADTKLKTKMINKFVDAEVIRARIELGNHASFGSGKIKLGNLITRNKFKLPEYELDSKGNKIKVWETDIEATLLPFAAGWAKLLANMEHATWAVDLKGFMKTKDLDKVMTEQGILDKLKLTGEEGRDLAKAIKMGIEQRVGTFSDNSINSSNRTWWRGYTAGLMRLQLGGPIPLSGVKNYFTQAIQMVHVFGLGDVLSHHMKALTSTERAITEFKGQGITTGIAGYKPTSAFWNKMTHLIFETGGMPFTEAFNKTWARLVSNTEAHRLATEIRTKDVNSKEYQYARDRLSEVFELSNYQIELIKKHGFEPNLQGTNIQNRLILRELEGILHQIEMVGNLKTAGSTIDSMQNPWANVKGLKPLLMYKRIAMHTTSNNIEMMRYNYKNGHMMKTALYFGGTYLSGAARIGILKMLLGKTLPDENSDFWGELFTVMWQGEFLGILSEVFSPYKKTWIGMDQNIIFDSAVGSHFKGMAELISTYFGHYTGAYETRKLPGKAAIDFFRTTSSTVNHTYQLMTQTTNQYNKDVLAIKKWKNDFDDKHSYWDDSGWEASESTKYMQNMKTAWHHGDLDTKKGMDKFKEAATIALLAKMSDYIGRGYTWGKAQKLASAELSRRIKDWDPIMGSMDASGRVITPSQGFLLSLDEKQLGTVRRARKKYLIRKNKFEREFHYYLRSQNLKDIAKGFKFELDPKYKDVLNIK